MKALIKDRNGRLLLVREVDGSWELPGGGLEQGEAAREALAREMAEETGLTVEWMSDRPEAFWTIGKGVGSPRLKWYAIVAYEAKVSGDFRPDPAGQEAQEAKYFARTEALALRLHDNTKPYFSMER